MALPPILVYHTSASSKPPQTTLLGYAKDQGYRVVETEASEDVLSLVIRGHPALLVLDGSSEIEAICDLLITLKGDPFTAIVPVVVWGDDSSGDGIERAFGAGVDDFLGPEMSESEKLLRLTTVVRRAERDLGVHPTTRLPGTAQIQRDVAERLEAGEQFAVCYADIDNFKEFNDRYGYTHGDRVIFLVSKILRDVVKEYSPSGFIGHIGGDDFIFIVPLDVYEVCCREIISIFDVLLPFQYSAEDRDARFFWGKDRRGQLHRIPLMTLSIGIVTNAHRTFSHVAQVGELATEMKAYAKTKDGSIYIVDRRQGRGEAEKKPGSRKSKKKAGKEPRESA